MNQNSLLTTEIKLKVLKLLAQNKKLSISNMELKNENEELKKIYTKSKK